jgi:hypothetical protein
VGLRHHDWIGIRRRGEACSGAGAADAGELGVCVIQNCLIRRKNVGKRSRDAALLSVSLRLWSAVNAASLTEAGWLGC